MSVNKKNILLLILYFSSISLFSQYTMNSPYSRYGIGDIEPSGFAINKSMGGTGIAMREKNQINYLNPASYTAQDSMSFIWDFGMKGNFTTYSTSGGSMKQQNFNFDHLALSFPITKWCFTSAGMIPYSKTGYNYFAVDSFSDGEKFKSSYFGSGNINRFYFGNGFILFDNKLNVGYNISYMFGSIQNNTLFSMISSKGAAYGTQTYKKYDAGITGWLFTLGAQSSFPISNDLNITVGATFEPRASLNAEVLDSTGRAFYIGNNRIDTALVNPSQNGEFVIPSRLGAGVSLQFRDKLMVGLDYTFQDWGKADFMGKENNLTSSSRLSCGIQYVHDKESFRNYFAKVRYRAGFYYEDTYLQFGNNGIKDYGFSVGLGLPFKRTNTIFNVGFEMGKRGTKQNGLFEDSYMRLALSVSLYDFWFYKRKFD